MRREYLPMNLQLFADGDGQQEGQQQHGQPENNQTGQKPNGNTGFDYEKLASIISGKQSVAEQSVLRNYFKEQGLSKEEAESAIAAFKEQRKANEPDIEGMKLELQQAQSMARNAMVEKEGIMLGIEMGLDAKSVPYVLKLTDTSKVIGEDGKINLETLKKAMNQVLEDVPALKPEKEETTGIRRVGSSGQSGQNGDQSSMISGIFGNAE